MTLDKFLDDLKTIADGAKDPRLVAPVNFDPQVVAALVEYIQMDLRGEPSDVRLSALRRSLRL
jgi:hypothetical protein